MLRDNLGSPRPPPTSKFWCAINHKLLNLPNNGTGAPRMFENYAGRRR